MQGETKTSFIPKKPIETSSNIFPVQSRKTKIRSFFTIIAFLIFIITVAGFAGVFFYKFALQRRIESQIESMRKIKDEFDEKFINDASRLDSRMVNVERLLNNHLSPSALFSLLEEYTLQSVSFNKFTFTDTKDGKIQITGNGEADNNNEKKTGFESIVLQSDSFGKSQVMKNILFSDLQPNIQKGTVTFTFSAILDPRVVLYKSTLPINTSSNSNQN